MFIFYFAFDDDLNFIKFLLKQLPTMALWNCNQALPYPIQRNQIRLPTNSFTSNRSQSRQWSQSQSQSHPYITAQKERQRPSKSLKQCNADNNGRYQAIGSSKSTPNPYKRSLKTNRKRKFIETFECDEEGQYEYNQSMQIIAPSRKKHISEQDVMKTVRDLMRNKPKAPKAWQQLIQTYCKNNRHCDVQQFTKIDNINNSNANKSGRNDDFKMLEKKKKRAVRLDPYGLDRQMYSSQSITMGSEAAKQAANRRYVNKNKQTIKNTKKNDSMDCD